MEFEFTVGAADRHKVRFHYSRLTNTVRIDVDGNLVKKDVYWLWIPATRRYDFEVGEAEQHEVVIETSMPRIGAKFSNPTCIVMVDGKFVREY